MRIISPCSEELKRRGLDPEGNPLKRPTDKKPDKKPAKPKKG